MSDSLTVPTSSHIGQLPDKGIRPREPTVCLYNEHFVSSVTSFPDDGRQGLFLKWKLIP